MKVEICIDSVEGMIAAAQGGADRVELCDNLMEGGTTSGAGMIKQACAQARIGLMVIMRPGGLDLTRQRTLISDRNAQVLTEPSVRMSHP